MRSNTGSPTTDRELDGSIRFHTKTKSAETDKGDHAHSTCYVCGTTVDSTCDTKGQNKRAGRPEVELRWAAQYAMGIRTRLGPARHACAALGHGFEDPLARGYASLLLLEGAAARDGRRSLQYELANRQDLLR